MSEEAISKKCTDCGEEKPLDAFYRNRGMADGRLKQCKPCFKIREEARFARKPELTQARRDRARAWAVANPGRVKANQAAYRVKHREKISARAREDYMANLEREREKSRLSYRKHRDKHAAYRKQWKERNREAVAAQDKRYVERYPEKVQAHRAIDAAIRAGRLVKPSDCQSCNAEPDSLDLHAHHPDYSKPFDVKWLCRKCHAREHRLEACRNATHIKASPSKALAKA